MHDEDSEEEEFVYPGASDVSAESPVQPDALVHQLPEQLSEPDIDEVLPATPGEDSDETGVIIPVPQTVLTKSHPSPAQLESLQAAASSGDLTLLKNLFRTALQTGEIEPFALANDASTRTGLTALHAAASRGYLDIVRWRKFYSSLLFVH